MMEEDKIETEDTESEFTAAHIKSAHEDIFIELSETAEAQILQNEIEDALVDGEVDEV